RRRRSGRSCRSSVCRGQQANDRWHGSCAITCRRAGCNEYSLGERPAMLPSPRLGRRRLLFATAAATIAAALPLEIAAAAPKDYETVGGYFFGQAAENDATGFTISDADGQSFWATFRGLGGAEILGFP